MHPDDVRELFACIDAEPRAAFSDALLTRLQSEHASVGHLPTGGAEPSMPPPILLHLDSDPVPRALDRRAVAPRRQRSRVVAAVAAAAALIVAGVVVTMRDDDVDLENPPADQPSTTVPPSALPEGLHALPPEGADPSLPVTAELLAELPMPIWVYEDGRVISARWSGSGVVIGDWSGFLEQRLTPEGVELVRAEIQASRPAQDLCRPGGPGGYGFSDGGRMVCAHSTSGGWEAVYPRLYELPDGAPSWLPASAWADPTTKPYVPSSYAIQISGDGDLAMDAVLDDLPPAVVEVLASAPQCEFDLFPPSHGDRLCWKVTTEAARVIVEHDGFTAQYDRGILMGPGWGYSFEMPPYLPHDNAVWCCGG